MSLEFWRVLFIIEECSLPSGRIYVAGYRFREKDKDLNKRFLKGLNERFFQGFILCSYNTWCLVLLQQMEERKHEISRIRIGLWPC